MDAAEKTGLVGSGDLVVITAGVPLGISGTTNMMKVHVVGHVLLTGDGVTEQDGFRPAVRVQAAVGHPPSASGTGTFWWCPRRTTPLWTTCGAVPASSPRRAAPTPTPPSRAWPWISPVITGAEHATDLLKSGAVVCLDAKKRPGQRLLRGLPILGKGLPPRQPFLFLTPCGMMGETQETEVLLCGWLAAWCFCR